MRLVSIAMVLVCAFAFTQCKKAQPPQQPTTPPAEGTATPAPTEATPPATPPTEATPPATPPTEATPPATPPTEATPPAAGGGDKATADECKAVFTHMFDLGSAGIPEEAKKMAKEQFDKTIDQQLKTCEGLMPKAQVECMTKAATLDEATKCATAAVPPTPATPPAP